VLASEFVADEKDVEALARGLLSALDAVEAADRQRDYLMLVAQRDIELMATARDEAEIERDNARAERDQVGDTARATIKKALLLKERAEASLAQAIKERDEALAAQKQTIKEDGVVVSRLRKERDRLAEGFAASHAEDCGCNKPGDPYVCGSPMTYAALAQSSAVGSDEA
jgi:hypothetical protein